MRILKTKITVTFLVLPIFAILATVLTLLIPISSALAQGEPKSNQFWWPQVL